MMRIIDRLNIGGPAIHAVVTSQGLDRGRFRTVLVMGSIESSEGDMAYLLEGEGIEKVVRVPTLGPRASPAPRSEHRLEADAIDAAGATAGRAHAQSQSGRDRAGSGAVKWRARPRPHIPRPCTARLFGPIKNRIYQLLERLLARASSQLVVPSPRLADELATDFRVARRGKFEVVPLGFDLAPFGRAELHRGELRRELGVDAQERR